MRTGSSTAWRRPRVAVRHDPQHAATAAPPACCPRYSDNAAVHRGRRGRALLRRPATPASTAGSDEPVDILIKVETHNHPTAISPFPGAATGSGGEIRDEGATGRGAKPKAGLVGFTVSNLRIPGFDQPWEADYGRPGAHRVRARHHARGPDRRRGVQQRIRAAQHPRLLPHVRAARRGRARGRVRGYHKPIMIAGGLGNVRAQHVEKRPCRRARRSSCSAARRC